MASFGEARWIFISLIVLVGLVGCNREGPMYSRLDKETALREWEHNEAVLAKAIDGESQEDQLINSVIFFQKLTGIWVRGDGTTFGYLLDEKAKDDLIRLQDWCEQHCDEIYWDEASQKVKWLPEKE